MKVFKLSYLFTMDFLICVILFYILDLISRLRIFFIIIVFLFLFQIFFVTDKGRLIKTEECKDHSVGAQIIEFLKGRIFSEIPCP